jgi:nicotinamidase-related amidase
MEKRLLNPKQTGFLVMDFQTVIVESYATDKQNVLSATASAISASRTAGIAVIYAIVGFRPGFPEISSQNVVFRGVKSAGGFSAAIHPQVAPIGDEVIIVKHRISAFFGTDLQMILRAQGINNLVMCGIATSGVVLSTLREASDMDYCLTILKDCCSDRDATVHDCLMERLFPHQAAVISAAEYIDSIHAN